MAALAFGTAVCGAFLQVLFDKLASPALKELTLRLHVRDELDRLQSTLLKIQTLVGHAEKHQAGDPNMTFWLKELKYAAFDSEDVLDEIAAEVLRLKMEGCDRGDNIPYGIASKINKIHGRLERIAGERGHLKLGNLGDCAGEHSQFVRTGQETSSVVICEPDMIFGRREEKDKLVNLLFPDDGDDNQNQMLSSDISVVAVVGVGGVGKSTIARLVYNNKKIEAHFDVRMWVFVSDDFDVKRLTRGMMESGRMGGVGNTSIGSLDRLQRDLKDHLIGKRFLLVLDDLWNEDPIEWEKLRVPLTYGARGSRVLVTTRKANVARVMGCRDPIILKGLSDGDCWLLLKAYAFGAGISDTYPNLEAIGKKIVQKLKGVPLAAKTVGVLLHSKLDERRWKELLEGELWELDQDENGIMPALRLSYYDLPPHLKPCFAYCSLFPRGHKYDKSKLVEIWMSQGFIQGRRGKRMEDVGSDYFDELVSRYFFQPSSGSYVMHGLLHDLAMLVSVDECLMIGSGYLHKVMDQDRRLLRHLSFSFDRSNQVLFENFDMFGSLRTLLCLNKYKRCLDNVVSDGLFSKIICLRLLDLSSSGIKHLPDTIGDLKQLRYLDLSETIIRKLPDKLCSIYNLQTLKFEGCRQLRELPKGMTKLVNLRHLNASPELVSEIAGIGNLTSLQNLEVFKVSKEKNQIVELKNMRELQGKLRICNLEKVENESEARQAELSCKEHLNALELIWDETIDLTQRDNTFDEKILECLQPPPDLKYLTIKNHCGLNFPSWLHNQCLHHVISLFLYKCKKWEYLPPLGQLPCLKSLAVTGMDGVKTVGREFFGSPFGFPSLEVLSFHEMTSWKEWIRIEGYELFSCLQKLVICDCPELEELPDMFPCLQHLLINGCSMLKRVHGLLPCLKKCSIHDCSKLEGLPGMFPSLQEVSINECPELKKLPFLPNMQRDQALRILSAANPDELSTFWTVERMGTTFWALRDLQLENCPGLLNKLLFSQLQCLNSVSCTIKNCYKDLEACRGSVLQHLNAHLPSLELQLSVNEEGPSGLQYVQSMTSDYSSVCLTFTKSSSDLATSNGDNNTSPLCKCLQEHLNFVYSLSFKGCEDVASLLGCALPHLRSLKILEIDSCGELASLLSSLEEDLVSLKVMKVENCLDLSLLPRNMLHHLKALEVLVIIGCEMLVMLEYQYLLSLKDMQIRGCSKLGDTIATFVAPQSCFSSSFQSLSTDNSSLITSSFKNNLTSLRKLTIHDSPKLEFFTEDEEKGLQDLKSLECFEICNCESLLSLPSVLHRISSLKSLRIRHCPKIHSLPEMGLPSSLEDLCIDGCPILKEWCQKAVVLNWHNIAQVSNRDIY